MTNALPSHHLKLSNEAATQSFASKLARVLSQTYLSTLSQNKCSNLQQGLVIFLSGPLGAGKTSWVRAFLRALGHQGRVRSPSFTIMEPYAMKVDAIEFTVHHFDFYRFHGKDELLDAGFDELIGAAGSISLIEWPEMAEQSLRQADLHLSFTLAPCTQTQETPARDCKMLARSPVGAKLVAGVLDEGTLNSSSLDAGFLEPPAPR